MLFNSYIYMFLFLPVVCSIYFLLAPHHEKASKIWLILASLFFYGWWNPIYIPLILASTFFNFLIGRHLSKTSYKRKATLILGITVNLATLGFFKYANFIADNLAFLDFIPERSWNIILPLSISFFTFQKIAYLVDCYKEGTREYKFINYMLFVMFFPQLLAGPIVHHKEVMPQFENVSNRHPHNLHIAIGLLLFSFGLFKKVVLADSYAVWATHGFDEAITLNFLEAWATSLSYTLQLYFDFSGYTDMAIGSALMFNIRLPFNFNSPYKARSIRDFWRRWHMTLSRFLRDYLYIPLGGDRRSQARTLLNLFLTFLLGGLWHGAAWTFVIWGALHGIAMGFCRLWERTNIQIPRFYAWVLTFLFINASWVIFRAKDWSSALKIYQAMADFTNISMINTLWISLLASGLLITIAMPNTNRLEEISAQKNIKMEWIAATAGFVVFISIIIYEIRKTSEFLYFQF